MCATIQNLFALCFVVGGCLGIKLVDHKYEDVYIAIQKTVKEDPQLIYRIKEAFTAASKLLFKATHNKVFFGKISIVIPKNWNLIEATPVSSISTSNYIEVSDGLHTDPYTRSTACGHEGVSVYMPPIFFMAETELGRKENVIVHEWGQYRWGLFPEYPDPNRRFYPDGGRWNPSMCSEHISGTIKYKVCLEANRSNPSRCDLNNTTASLPKECKFCPDRDSSGNQKANASILSYQYVSSLAFFCDKDDPSVPVWQRHNKKAYTKQNYLCNHKSAWEVMREHTDFQSEASLPDGTNTTPEFKVLRETDAIRVFVFDISGSMDTNGRIGQLHMTGSHIIKEKLPLGSWLGIVWFNDDADEFAKITQINNDDDRQSLVGGVPDNAYGGTCIGCGLQVALEMLQRKFGTAENSEIILMSDGQDNDPLKLEEATLNAKQAKVTIHTVSISQEADQRMIDLAVSTGGKYFTYLDKGRTSFEAVFSEAISSGITEQSTKALKLISDRSLGDTNVINFQFTVDHETGSNTTITVFTNLKSKENITMVIKGPDQKVYHIAKEDVSITYHMPQNLRVNT
ncbi:hypothetical protein DPMN_138747 [Dreissena polymorpha]|uniref:VWFA domain-containing protein n=1 Tax=Dreissena polymorpha TaxID=45954 RepID=A0A9D4G7S0_DREPO|nr:hypothetical protein DPMN_138747 [Dreissena polymorpha]